MVSLNGFGKCTKYLHDSFQKLKPHSFWLQKSIAPDSQVCKRESVAHLTLPKGCSESQMKHCVQKARVKGARKQ